MFYVCLGKTGPDWEDPRCKTAIASAAIWDRLRDDPLAVGQRWYCKRCPTRYKTSFGIVVEL
eukprot:11172352-Lingulodinium_polyedra.AAC.1